MWAAGSINRVVKCISPTSLHLSSLSTIERHRTHSFWAYPILQKLFFETLIFVSSRIFPICMDAGLKNGCERSISSRKKNENWLLLQWWERAKKLWKRRRRGLGRWEKRYHWGKRPFSEDPHLVIFWFVLCNPSKAKLRTMFILLLRVKSADRPCRKSAVKSNVRIPHFCVCMYMFYSTFSGWWCSHCV